MRMRYPVCRPLYVCACVRAWYRAPPAFVTTELLRIVFVCRSSASSVSSKFQLPSCSLTVNSDVAVGGNAFLATDSSQSHRLTDSLASGTQAVPHAAG